MPKRTWVASSATSTTPSGCIRASATCRRSSSKTTTFAPEGVDFAGGSVLGVQSSLMTDQALNLNQAIGGAVRALVAPMRESNSRAGKQEVEEQLSGRHDHGIRIIYL